MIPILSTQTNETAKDIEQIFHLNTNSTNECNLTVEIYFIPGDPPFPPYHPYNVIVNMYLYTPGRLSYFISDLEAKHSIKRILLGTYPTSMFHHFKEDIAILWKSANGKPSKVTLPISTVTIVENCKGEKEVYKNYETNHGPEVHGKMIALVKEGQPFRLIDAKIIHRNNGTEIEDIDAGWIKNSLSKSSSIGSSFLFLIAMSANVVLITELKI